MPPPILATPVSTIQPGKSSNKTPESSLRIKGASSLLSATRHYVEENIKKIMSLILETWDLANNFVSLGSKIQNTREYLQVDLTNDEGFYKDALSTFVINISGMTEYQRKQEYFPSQTRVKQLKACWIKMINILRELLGDLNALSRKKVEAYSKLMGLDIVGTTIEVQDPNLIVNSILQTRQQFEEHVEILKGLSAEKFNNMVEYTKHDIESWLVEYVNRNEDIEITLQQLSIDYREIESTLFDIKVKQEVTISPLRDYIEKWLESTLIKIIEENQAEAVGTDEETVCQTKYKRNNDPKMRRRFHYSKSELITSLSLSFQNSSSYILSLEHEYNQILIIPFILFSGLLCLHPVQIPCFFSSTLYFMVHRSPNPSPFGQMI
jgi:hypothetical protein